MKINRKIDHTFLSQNVKKEDILKVCAEAEKYNFKAVCIPPTFVALAKERLKNTNTSVCTVIGFPFGYNKKENKILETNLALEDGADEIDMVMNIGAFLDKNYKEVISDMQGVRGVCKNAILKVIIETGLLSDEEIVKACELVLQIGADFVKTSTGFASSGAKIEDIILIKETVKEKIKIKASGGIRNKKTAFAMIEAGADRLGTSSGVKLL